MAASATAEPDTPPIRVERTTETCPMEPYIWPVSTFASFTRRDVIPVLFIRLPAKINSGIASMVKDWVVDRDFCTRIVHGISGLIRKKENPDTAMAKATGIPRNRRIKKNPTALNIN